MWFKYILKRKVVDHTDSVTTNWKTVFLYEIKHVFQHPDWNNSGYLGFPNDIAVMRLSTSADLSSPYISTITMASDGEDFVGDECYITGWGRTSGRQ